MMILFITGILLLTGFIFLPIGYLNESAIVLVPLFFDTIHDENIWAWQNSAAFVITYFISILLLIYFNSKDNRIGSLAASVVCFVSVLIIFTIVWMMDVSLSSSYTFTYGIGWIFWLAGLILIFVLNNKKPAV